MTPNEIKAALDAHKKWLRGEDGERADLRSADLRSQTPDLKSEMINLKPQIFDLQNLSLRYSISVVAKRVPMGTNHVSDARPVFLGNSAADNQR